MRTYAEQMIASQDVVLSDLRSEWIAAPEKDKQKWMTKINNALDLRLQMMEQRNIERS